MYRGASAAFYEELKKASRIEHVRGSIGGVYFDDSNIVSLHYSNRCSDTSDISFGYAYIGQVNITFIDINILRGSWRNKAISLDYGLELPDGTTEFIPIGVFYVSEAKWNDIGIEVTASDVLSKLDKGFGVTSTAGTVKELFDLVALNARITFDLTEEEVAALPNGAELLGLYPESDIETNRDFCGWLSQVVGGFCTATRDGKLTVRSYSDAAVVDTLYPSDRIMGSVFSDYSTLYYGVSVVNMADKTVSVYSGGDGSDGSVINLGSNPLLQYGTPENRDRQRTTLAQLAHSLRYTPFSIGLLNNPVYDLGDVVENVGGVAGDVALKCCIMSIDWSFKQTTDLAGFGADPALSSAKSKTDKNISGLSSSTKSDSLVFFNYMNANQYSIGNVRTMICNLEAANTKTTFVDFWIEIKADITVTGDAAVLHFNYALDDIDEIYEPIITFHKSGIYTFNLHYYWRLESVLMHSFKVFLEVDGGTADINVADIHASLTGQGMTEGDAFSGRLEFEDTFRLKQHRKIRYPFHDDPNISFVQKIPETFDVIGDEFVLPAVKKNSFNFTESVDVIARTNVFRIVTEDRARLVTEDGQGIRNERG